MKKIYNCLFSATVMLGLVGIQSCSKDVESGVKKQAKQHGTLRSAVPFSFTGTVVELGTTSTIVKDGMWAYSSATYAGIDSLVALSNSATFSKTIASDKVPYLFRVVPNAGVNYFPGYYFYSGGVSDSYASTFNYKFNLLKSTPTPSSSTMVINVVKNTNPNTGVKEWVKVTDITSTPTVVLALTATDASGFIKTDGISPNKTYQMDVYKEAAGTTLLYTTTINTTGLPTICTVNANAFVTP